MIAIGIDPGSRWVGVAVVDLGLDLEDGLLAWHLWHRDRRADPAALPPFGWLEEIAATVTGLRLEHPGALVAIEQADLPLPWVKGRTHDVHPREIGGLQRAHGYLVGRLRPVVQVPQRGQGNGKGPDLAYPAVLRRGIRGRWTKSDLEHVRSATDVARKAPQFARLQGAMP